MIQAEITHKARQESKPDAILAALLFSDQRHEATFPDNRDHR